MRGKLLGAVCLSAAALWVLLSGLRQQRQQTALLRELAAALESMAAAIRWQGRPLPQIMAELTRYPTAGVYFRRICRMVENGTPMAEAWQEVFSRVSAAEELAALELSGDAEKLTSALLYGAEQVKKRCEQRRIQQRQTTKLWCAGVLSCAGLLIILLI